MAANDLTVATRLRQLLDERGLSIRGLAKELGRDKSQVTKWVSGQVVPGPRNAQMLADYFKKPADFFVTPRERTLTQAERIAALEAQLAALQARLEEG